MDKLEIQNSVSLCPPGPHGVLVTVPLNYAFTKAQRVAIEGHMSLMSPSVWSHAAVLFTWGDLLGDRSIEQHIEDEGEDLHWLLDKCGYRYHVFNNLKRDDTQVTQLLEKIDQMVAGNRGAHYEQDGGVREKLSERKRNIEERVHTFMTKTQRQRTALKGDHQSLPDVKVMLVGGEQDQRSRAGDVILQEAVFTETLSKEAQTKLTECVRQQRRVADKNVSVVICPDWSTTPPSQKTKEVLLHGVTLCSPEPHAVLLPVSVMSSFSEADRRSVEELMELLGDRVWRDAQVLFTEGWWLGGRRVEEYIESEGEPLRWLLEKCGYRHHVLDGVKWDISEVTELMEKIEDMVTMNRGHFEPSDSREDRSVKVGHETMQTTLFETLPRSDDRKVADWLKTLPEPDIDAPSSDYDSMSEVSSVADSGVSEDIEKITPEKLSRGRFQAQLKGEGTFECEETGLIFQAKESVLVRYSGPIFNVHTVDKEASALTSIQLPRSLRLAGPENERVFGALHVTGKRPITDRVKSSGSHRNSSASSPSPVGSIPRDTQLVEQHHGAVLVYEDLSSSVDNHTFRIYLALNCRSSQSHIQEIEEEMEKKGHYRRLHKNSLCLLLEREYRLTSEPRGTIHPEHLIFTLVPVVEKGFFEASYEQPPPFTFYLEMSGTGVTRPTWSTNIQLHELVGGTTEKKPSKQQLLRVCSEPALSQSNVPHPEQTMASTHAHTLQGSSVKILVTNKVKLLEGLNSDLSYILQHAHADEIIDTRVYTILMKSPEDACIKLIDIIINKGEGTSSQFLKLLKKNEILNTYPKLKELN